MASLETMPEDIIRQIIGYLTHEDYALLQCAGGLQHPDRASSDPVLRARTTSYGRDGLDFNFFKLAYVSTTFRRTMIDLFYNTDSMTWNKKNRARRLSKFRSAEAKALIKDSQYGFSKYCWSDLATVIELRFTRLATRQEFAQKILSVEGFQRSAPVLDQVYRFLETRFNLHDRRPHIKDIFRHLRTWRKDRSCLCFRKAEIEEDPLHRWHMGYWSCYHTVVPLCKKHYCTPLSRAPGIEYPQTTLRCTYSLSDQEYHYSDDDEEEWSHHIDGYW